MLRAVKEKLDEIEREREVLLGLLSRAPMGFGEIDASGRFIAANPEISLLIQAAAPKVPHGNVFDFLKSVAPDLAERARGFCEGDGPGLQDARFAVAGDGLEALSFSLTRGRSGAFFVTLRDATENRDRKSAGLRDAADEASRLRSEAASAGGHEFRLNGPAPPALLKLLDDALDAARLGGGVLELKPAPFELRAMVGEAIERLRGEAEAKGFGLTEEFDRIGAGTFCGDGARLRQILEILLSHAIRRTRSGGVKLRVRGMPETGGRWRLRMEVRDSGPGVAEDVKARMFQPLAKYEPSFGEAGLSLSLARGLMDLMGGGCGVADRPGGGSIFWIEVSLPVAGPQPAAAPQAAAAPERPSVVLVVDDGKVNAEIARLVLSSAGFQVEIATDGLAAVEAARTRDFALILMDVHMPRMDGFAATRAIRALSSAAARAPIIGMSASTSAETQALGREAGMNDYVVKPLAPARLRAVANQWTRAGVA